MVETLLELFRCLLPLCAVGVGVPLVLIVSRPIFRLVLRAWQGADAARQSALLRASYAPYSRRGYY